MILRNLTPKPLVVTDGAQQKSVPPAGLVAVSPETGRRLLADEPSSWAPEQALIPPPPPSR